MTRRNTESLMKRLFTLLKYESKYAKLYTRTYFDSISYDYEVKIMPQKEVFLRAFKVSCSDLNSEENVSEKLIQALNNSHSVNHRRLSLHAESSKEDLLSCYEIKNGHLFCTMVRANMGNEVKSITEELFKEKTFPLSKLRAKTIQGTSSIYDFSYYFALFGDILITNLPRPHTITSTQTYINWLIKDTRYEITPLISKTQVTELSKIDNLTFEDDFLRKTSAESSTTSIFLKDEFIRMVRRLFVDAKSMEDVDFDQLISAKLVIKFRKSKVERLTELQNVYGALLKPMSDLDNITIRTRDRKKLVKGSNLQLSQSIKIGLLEDGLLEEPSLFQAMERFYSTIEKD